MRRVLFFFGILFLASAALLSWFVPRAWFWTGDAGHAIAITIHDKEFGSETGKELVRLGIIDSSIGWDYYVALFNGEGNFPKPGVYRIPAHASYRTIVRMLVLGPPRNEVKITVPEGWTIDQINASLTSYNASIPKIVPDALRSEYPFLASLPKDASLEGYLFPETYFVYADQLPQSLIVKQLDEFATRAPGIEAEAAKQGRTLRDVVILASIIEKEVSKPEDRAIVASIFLNRLKDGMALQSDATVNYITHAGRARPTLDDLKADSPYNTYAYKGLPPGPISNPGDSALLAALHPAQTDYRYFLTDDAGKTYFARTFAEHQQNRTRVYGK